MQKVINEHMCMTVSGSVPLNDTGKTWKIDINGMNGPGKCIQKGP